MSARTRACAPSIAYARMSSSRSNATGRSRDGGAPRATITVASAGAAAASAAANASPSAANSAPGFSTPSVYLSLPKSVDTSEYAGEIGA
ncbi:hypothetical protein Y026_1965 [Burkholderia pseudomallei TSV28]|nr:hypothetical protein Y026_1965 [Burkholderia pseudomallei TSV28]